MICIARTKKQRQQRVHTTEMQLNNVCACVWNKEMCVHSTSLKESVRPIPSTLQDPELGQHKLWTCLGGIL